MSTRRTSTAPPSPGTGGRRRAVVAGAVALIALTGAGPASARSSAARCLAADLRVTDKGPSGVAAGTVSHTFALTSSRTCTLTGYGLRLVGGGSSRLDDAGAEDTLGAREGRLRAGQARYFDLYYGNPPSPGDRCVRTARGGFLRPYGRKASVSFALRRPLALCGVRGVSRLAYSYGPFLP